MQTLSPISRSAREISDARYLIDTEQIILDEHARFAAGDGGKWHGIRAAAIRRRLRSAA